ncbi:endonuclease dU [Scytonema millei]|uniref:endonuclease dU n=1 Tax=Scytonema millei TaxID=1245922 RepID=UPI0005842C22|nr:DUF99 family protein [Scytonema millei]
MMRHSCADAKVHAYPPFFFQVCGEDPDVIATVVQRLSDRGHVPEALRLAHLIGAEVVKGESGSSALRLCIYSTRSRFASMRDTIIRSPT